MHQAVKGHIHNLIRCPVSGVHILFTDEYIHQVYSLGVAGEKLVVATAGRKVFTFLSMNT